MERRRLRNPVASLAVHLEPSQHESSGRPKIPIPSTTATDRRKPQVPTSHSLATFRRLLTPLTSLRFCAGRRIPQTPGESASVSPQAAEMSVSSLNLAPPTPRHYSPGRCRSLATSLRAYDFSSPQTDTGRDVRGRLPHSGNTLIGFPGPAFIPILHWQETKATTSSTPVRGRRSGHGANRVAANVS